MRTGVEEGRLFRELDEHRGILILPNPWDAGTAKLLASVGFEALATSSLGMSNAFGRETDASDCAPIVPGCCGAGSSARATTPSFLSSYREADRLRSFSRAAHGGTSRFQRHESARARPKKPTRLSSHTRRTKSSALSDIVSLCR
jgi:Phosphoenolpyruvate phosphomutase